MKRVIAYVDGFNLYHGLRERGWKKFYWLNIQLMIRHLLKDDENLVKTKYFTTRVDGPEPKRKRQAVFIEALETLDDFQFFYGKFLSDDIECHSCGHVYMTHHEKMTDVNIAVEMLSDAYNDEFDLALLVSADSDLVGMINAIHNLKGKGVVVVFPPSRYSRDLEDIAKGVLHLDYPLLAKSSFPEEVTKQGGFVLRRPDEWRANVAPLPKKKSKSK